MKRMNKTEQIISYLKRNNNERINRLAKNELEIDDVAEHCDTSKQMVFSVINNQMGYDIGKLRKENIKERGEIALSFLKEVITVDELYRNGYLNHVVVKTSKDVPKTIKQKLIKRFISYGVFDKYHDDNLKYVLIDLRYQSYVVTIQLERLLKSNEHDYKKIIDKFGVTRSRLMKVKDTIDIADNALPRMDKDVRKLIERNIEIAKDSATLSDVELEEKYKLSRETIQMILNITKPYVVFDLEGGD